MPRVLLALAFATTGCVSGSVRDAWPLRDSDQHRVRGAIGPVVEPSFERHIRGDGRTANPFGSFSGYSCTSGEAYWGVTFTYRTATGAARDVSVEEGRRILAGVQTDVQAAVEKTGANVTWAPVPEVGAGPNPEGRFVIMYLRKLTDASGEISGEIVGKLTPIKGSSEPSSQVRIDFKERVCE